MRPAGGSELLLAADVQLLDRADGEPQAPTGREHGRFRRLGQPERVG
jgi:hypothetical protein